MHDDDDHPLLVELASLRQTAARFQHEAHTAAIKLQHHSFESARLHEHAAALEQENARLVHEISVLRAHPDVPHHPAVVQVQELSLALRRISEKIALTEDTLLQRTSELTDAHSELLKARHAAEGAYALAASMRAREETSKARERELEFKARASEEERKRVDLVVQEYADLVRNLEGRKSANSVQNGSASATALSGNLHDARSNLHGMLTAFSTESEQLHATIAEFNTKISDLQMTLDAERSTASHDRSLLSQTKTELDKLILEDQTAAKMVARYMKFSQASTNALQQQITTLKARNASTINTLELQLSIVETQLSSEHTRTARLQDALDELCEDLARESYGRRREIALRLSLLSREESIAEFLRRWARRAKESYARCYNSIEPPVPHATFEDAAKEAFHRVVSDAESLLSTLDDDVQFSDAIRTSGPLARMMISREAVEALRSELQDEVQKRMEVVRKVAFYPPDGYLDGIPSETEELQRLDITPMQSGNGTQKHPLLTPNGDARPEPEAALVEFIQPRNTTESVSVVGVPEESIDDPFIPAPPADPIEQTAIQGEMRSLPSPPMQDSASTLVTLLDEEPKGFQTPSPAVSMLDLQQDPQPHIEEPLSTEEREALRSDSSGVPTLDLQQDRPCIEPSTTEEISVHIFPDPTLPLLRTNQDAQPLSKHTSPLSSASESSPTLTTSYTSSNPSPTPTLLSELGATKHRYDTLQHAFRDCSLALKELKRTLTSSSPSLRTHTVLHQHLEMALARIDDYTEDARVELEIRIADEELTARGFETVLSVPGALMDPEERAEVEASAGDFINGTDDGVVRALDKFGKKLEDVQHDVAVVKRTIHELAMSDGLNGEDGVDVDMDAGSGAGSGWTAWTAGLLGATTSPSRSQTPAQTFGAVITSPRLRRTPSLKELQAQASTGETDGEPLAGLNLRIPMPSTSSSHPSLRHVPLGLGHATEATRPRTISTMYAMGGLRSSSVGLGVGLGGSPSRVRRLPGGVGRPEGGIGWGGTASAMHAGRGNHVEDTRAEEHDLGGVE